MLKYDKAYRYSESSGVAEISSDGGHVDTSQWATVAATIMVQEVDAPGGGTLSFSEYAVNTVNPVFTLADNIVYTSGVIYTDGANPTSPVLAGSTNYQAPISIAFSNPVLSVSLDAGYFDNLQSTQILFYDVGGNLLNAQYNGAYGIQNFTFSSDIGIASVLVRAISVEEAGFAIDNLAVGPAIEDLQAPFIQAGTLPGGVTASFGNITDGTAITLLDQLAPGDHSDTFSFQLDTNAKVTFQVRLVDRPDEVRTFTSDFTIGNHMVSVFDDPDYQSAHEYYLSVLNVEITATDRQALIDKAAREIASDLLDGTMTVTQLAGDIRSLALSGAEARTLMSKMAGYLGPLGRIADGLFRLTDVHTSPNPGREAFIQLADFTGALAAEMAGLSIGFAVGAGAGAFLGGFGAAPGSVVGQLAGGFLGPVLYTWLASDAVQAQAAQYWDAHTAPITGPAQALAIAADVIDALIPFDADWYLATYADAKAAVESGESPSAFAHFLTIGLAAGYQPNADTGPISPADLAGDPGDLASALFNEALYTVAAGQLRGDTISPQESLLLAQILAVRTGDLPLDAELSTLANRKAIDLVANFADPAFDRQAKIGPGWADAWSSGEALADGAARFAGTFDGLSMIAMASSGQSPEEAMASILGSFENRNLLLDLDTMRIGIAEYGGVWVVMLADGTVSASPVLDASAHNASRIGTGAGDHIALGTWTGSVDGLGGDDVIDGSVGADILSGGDDNDVIDGRGGGDTLIGGDGNDVLIAHSISRPVDIAPIVKPQSLANATLGTAVSIDTGFELTSDPNVANSAAKPHATVTAIAHGGMEYYSFTVDQAGSEAIFDIDATGMFDTYIILYDAAGNQIAYADDHSPADSGSDKSTDPYLTYTFDTTGTYYLLVRRYGGSAIAAGEAYTLNVTMDHAYPTEVRGATMTGGAGDDIYHVSSSTDNVVEADGQGNDNIFSSVSYSLAGRVVETLTLTGTDNINATGNGRGNIIIGNDGNNSIDGGAGADVLTGGLGDDIYYVDNVGDTVVEADNGGTDRIYASVSYSLAGRIVETLTLIGTANIDGTGNGRVNRLEGNAGNNILRGEAGADTLRGASGADILIGGAGDDVLDGGADVDTASYVDATAGVTVSLAIGGAQNTGAAGVDTLVSIEKLTGSAFNDSLAGSAGNDTLDGGAGADVLTGGLGDDIYYVDNVGDTVVEADNGGTDRIYASVSYSLAGRIVETLTLTGSDNIDATGNGRVNVLEGNAGGNVLRGEGGNDSLYGANGADILIGGAGNDLLDGGVHTDTASYVDATAGVTVSLAISGAQNTGGAGVDTLIGIEKLTGSAFADSLTGDAGSNVLDGGAGADILTGGAGDDTYYVDHVEDNVVELNDGGADRIFASVSYSLAGRIVETLTLTGATNINATGNGRVNVLNGNSGSNSLWGLDGGDQLNGGAGNDLLYGGLGRDTLTGGAGKDRFIFDTALGGDNVDGVVDFSVVDDTILLDDAVFTGLAVGGLSAAAFRIGATAADASDRILYDSVTGNLYFDTDGNGAGAAIRFAQLGAGLALTQADFVVG